MTALPPSSAEAPAGYPNKNSNNRKTASSLSHSHRPRARFLFPSSSLTGRDPFKQNSNRSDREKWSTSKGGPVFSKLFRLDRTDPLSFGPKFPEILVEWIAPTASLRHKEQEPSSCINNATSNVKMEGFRLELKLKLWIEKEPDLIDDQVRIRGR